MHYCSGVIRAINSSQGILLLDMIIQFTIIQLYTINTIKVKVIPVLKCIINYYSDHHYILPQNLMSLPSYCSDFHYNIHFLQCIIK